MSQDRWVAGYNCGIVAAAAHLKQKSMLEKEASGMITRDGQLYDACAAAILRKMKPVGIELPSEPEDSVSRAEYEAMRKARDFHGANSAERMRQIAALEREAGAR